MGCGLKKNLLMVLNKKVNQHDYRRVGNGSSALKIFAWQRSRLNTNNVRPYLYSGVGARIELDFEQRGSCVGSPQ